MDRIVGSGPFELRADAIVRRLPELEPKRLPPRAAWADQQDVREHVFWAVALGLAVLDPVLQAS